MDEDEDDDLGLPRGWEELAPARARQCTDQLRFELGPDDPLGPWFVRGAIRAVGGSVSADYVVYEIDDWEAPYFVSHLSWTGADDRPAWLRKLKPRPRPDPGVVPISWLGDLAGWGD